MGGGGGGRHIFIYSCYAQLIDLTDYSRLANGLVSMFASFSLASTRKGYVPSFSARIWSLLSLNSIISLDF